MRQAVCDDKPRVDLAVPGNRELSIIGTHQYADYEEAVRRIAPGDIVTGPLETNHFPFADYAAAYDFIDREGPQSMKVFLYL